MDNSVLEGDRLFLIAESLAQDHSLLPGIHTSDDYGGIGGLLSPVQIAREHARLEHFDIDTYIEKVVAPAEKKDRKPAPEVIREIGRVNLLTSKDERVLARKMEGGKHIYGIENQLRGIEDRRVSAWEVCLVLLDKLVKSRLLINGLIKYLDLDRNPSLSKIVYG